MSYEKMRKIPNVLRLKKKVTYDITVYGAIWNYYNGLVVWKNSVNISLATTDDILLDLCLTVIKCWDVLEQNGIRAQKLFPPSDLRILPSAHEFSLFL